MSLRKSPSRTQAFLAANRANAQKSTGPRTPEGKARVDFGRAVPSHTSKDRPTAGKSSAGFTTPCTPRFCRARQEST